VRLLVKNKRHAEAVPILRALETRKPELEVECLEATGDSAGAAALIREIPSHPAAESYEWLIQLRALLAQRPANLNKIMTPAENKVLEQLLEQGLGVKRKPRAATKTAVKKAAKQKVPYRRDPNPYS
jgi:hypothetical protein